MSRKRPLEFQQKLYQPIRGGQEPENPEDAQKKLKTHVGDVHLYEHITIEIASDLVSSTSNDDSADMTEKISQINVDPEIQYAIQLDSATVPVTYDNIYNTTVGVFTANNVIKINAFAVPIASIVPQNTPNLDKLLITTTQTHGITGTPTLQIYDVTEDDGTALSPTPNTTIVVDTVVSTTQILTAALAGSYAGWGAGAPTPPTVVNGLVKNNTAPVTTALTFEYPRSHKSLEQMFDWLYKEMIKISYKKTVNGVTSVYISFEEDLTTKKVWVYFSSYDLFQIDFTVSNSIRQLWGFDASAIDYSDNVAGEVYVESENKNDIKNGISSININCDLVDPTTTWRGKSTGTSIATYVPAPYGTIQQVENPNKETWHQIKRTHNIHSIRIWITDNLNRLLNLHNEQVNIKITLRSIHTGYTN